MRLLSSLPDWQKKFLRHIAIHVPGIFETFCVDDELKNAEGPVVLVYSDGAMGNSSLTPSLKSCGQGVVRQSHFLYPKNLKAHQIRLGQRAEPLKLYKWLIEKRREVKMITMTRQPHTQYISRYFKQINRNGMIKSLSIDEIINRITQDLEQIEYFDWFAEEMKPCTGIDVYDHDFPTTDGYRIIESENIGILVINSELRNEQKDKLIRDYTGFQNFAWKVSGNSAEKDGYMGIYHDFFARFELSEKAIENLAASKYLTHFYGKDALAFKGGQ
jgi:hypothetical protein